MFVSFFPRPKLFFLSVIVWTALAMAFLVWLAGNLSVVCARRCRRWRYLVGTVRFGSTSIRPLRRDLRRRLDGVRAASLGACPSRSALILFTSYFQVQVSVAINSWYGPFYDLVQARFRNRSGHGRAVSTANLSTFAGMPWSRSWWVMTRFFVSHYIFRWRTGLNDFYIAKLAATPHRAPAAARCLDGHWSCGQFGDVEVVHRGPPAGRCSG